MRQDACRMGHEHQVETLRFNDAKGDTGLLRLARWRRAMPRTE